VAHDQFGQIFITDSNKHRLEDALGMLLDEASLFTVEKSILTKKLI